MKIHGGVTRQICDKCGKTFQSKYNLSKHIENEHLRVQSEPLQCLICNTWYRNPDGLKAHNKNMHSNSDTEHRCHICQKVSTTHRALLRHINFNHVRERKFKCTMCEKAFKRSQDLKVSLEEYRRKSFSIKSVVLSIQIRNTFLCILANPSTHVPNVP